MHLPKAIIKIKLGKDPKDYIEIIGKSTTYKRSRIRMSRKGEEISALVEAKDSRALLASMQSLLKQLRVVAGVDSMLDELSGKKTDKV